MQQKIHRWKIDLKPKILTLQSRDLLRLWDEVKKSSCKSALRHVYTCDEEPRTINLTQVMITVNGNPHLLMFDKDFVHECEDSIRSFIDGTFSVIPPLKDAKQMITVMMEMMNMKK